jgi:hypothetical protein
VNSTDVRHQGVNVMKRTATDTRHPGIDVIGRLKATGDEYLVRLTGEVVSQKRKRPISGCKCGRRE